MPSSLMATIQLGEPLVFLVEGVLCCRRAAGIFPLSVRLQVFSAYLAPVFLVAFCAGLQLFGFGLKALKLRGAA